MKEFRVSEAQARSIITQVVDGLSYIHEQGFIHCDMKLENILVDSDSDFKVEDG